MTEWMPGPDRAQFRTALRVLSLSSGVLAASAVALAGITAQAATYNEAPELAARVAAGTLPPVEERLPKNPEVITPVEQVGQYGGVVRRGLSGSNDHNNILRFVSPQGLTRWSADFSELLPNVAERYEVSDDASAYTFFLREGMKWSDGQPFTADDIVFFAEDLLTNSDFYSSPPSRYVIDGQPMMAEKIDDYTVTLSFAGPYGQFLQELATPLGQEPVLWAKHYCSQFHPTYNPDIDALVANSEATDWASLFRMRCGDLEIPARWGNPERPTLDPWVVTDEAYTGGATRVVMERNPYFWQVDTEGNQLPYIDQVISKVNQDAETLVLEVIAGNIDLQSRHLDAPQNRPVFFENMEKGGYKFFNLANSSSNAMGIYPNLTHPDSAMREMFNDRDFRVALSLGIDREELIDIIWLGEGEPWQIGAKPSHALYDERLSRQYTEYDPDRANELLDQAGYDQRDSEGFRLRPDGERVFFSVDVVPNLSPEWVDALELIKEHWADIGIDMNINTIERSIFYERGDSNNFDMAIWSAPGGLDPYLSPRNVMAVHPQGSRMALPWATWYVSGGNDGMEPSDSMKQRLALYDEFKRTADPAEQERIFKEIHSMAADAFEVIGIVTDPDRVGIQNVNLRNVPTSMPRAWMYPNPGPTLPQQFFFDNLN